MQFVGVISVALLLAAGGAAYVLYPLIASRRKGKDYLPADSLAEPAGLRRELKLAREERDRLYGSLAELDHDFYAGDLNREDYLRLRAEYKNQAVATLIDLDRLEARVEHAGAEIEQVITKMLSRVVAARKTKTQARAVSPGSQAATTLKSRSEGGKVETETTNMNTGATADDEEEPLRLGRFCQRCGREAEMSDTFCSRCGMKLARLEVQQVRQADR